MTITETIEQCMKERKARVEELKNEITELRDNIVEVETEYGLELENYPEPIRIQFQEWVNAATTIREEMLEIKRVKEIDELYLNIDSEIDALVS